MENSPFSKLPAELRSEIYERVLVEPEFIDATADHETSERGWGLLTSGGDATQMMFRRFKGATIEKLALTFTCKAIRHECANLYWSLNTFKMLKLMRKTCDERLGPGTHLAMLRATIGHQNSKYLRKIVVTIRDGYICQMDDRAWMHLRAAQRKIEVESQKHPLCDFNLHFPSDSKTSRFTISIDARDPGKSWDRAIAAAIATVRHLIKESELNEADELCKLFLGEMLILLGAHRDLTDEHLE